MPRWVAAVTIEDDGQSEAVVAGEQRVWGGPSKTAMETDNDAAWRREHQDVYYS